MSLENMSTQTDQTPTEQYTYLAGLSCRRCNGHTLREVDPHEGLDKTASHACPHCHTGQTTPGKIYRSYSVTDYEMTSSVWDPSWSLEDIEPDHGTLTFLQWRDFKAVNLRGVSISQRARERGVVHGSIYSSVKAAEEKLGLGGL